METGTDHKARILSILVPRITPRVQQTPEESEGREREGKTEVLPFRERCGFSRGPLTD